MELFQKGYGDRSTDCPKRVLNYCLSPSLFHHVKNIRRRKNKARSLIRVTEASFDIQRLFPVSEVCVCLPQRNAASFLTLGFSPVVVFW